MLGPITNYLISTPTILRHSSGNEWVANIWLDNTGVTAGADGRKVLVAGTLVTRKTVGLHMGVYDSGASDGRQTLTTAAGAEYQCGILRNDEDVTDGPVLSTMYVGNAQFEKDNLTLNGATVGNLQTAMPFCKFL